MPRLRSISIFCCAFVIFYVESPIETANEPFQTTVYEPNRCKLDVFLVFAMYTVEIDREFIGYCAAFLILRKRNKEILLDFALAKR